MTSKRPRVRPPVKLAKPLPKKRKPPPRPFDSKGRKYNPSRFGSGE